MVFTNYLQLDYIGLFLEIFLFFSSIVLLMLGVFFVSLRQYKYVNFVKEFHYMLLLVFFFSLMFI